MRRTVPVPTRSAGDGRQSTLISPEVREPIGRELGIAHLVLDVLVAEIVLQGRLYSLPCLVDCHGVFDSA
jgi:hypothetical protein